MLRTAPTKQQFHWYRKSCELVGDAAGARRGLRILSLRQAQRHVPAEGASAEAPSRSSAREPARGGLYLLAAF